MPEINIVAYRRENTRGLEKTFPDPSVPDFLRLAHLNWNAGAGDLSFRVFEGLVRKRKPKSKRYLSFFVWLYLCIKRPWLKNSFPLGALKVRTIDARDIMRILKQLRIQHRDDFPYHYIAEEKTLRSRVKAKDLAELLERFSAEYEIPRRIAAALTPTFLSDLHRIARKNKVVDSQEKLCRLLTLEPQIKVRDVQRKFHWNADTCAAVLRFAELEGWISLRKYRSGSAWVVLKEKRTWELSPDYNDKLTQASRVPRACQVCAKTG